MTTKQNAKKTVYQIVTTQITNCMEDMILPWQVSWAENGLPKNLFTGKPYRSVNVPLLAMCAFPINLFVTEGQLSSLGGTVKKDERPVMAVYWEWKEFNPGEGKRAVLRYEWVYNVTQCDGLTFEDYVIPEHSLAICRDYVKRWENAPQIVYGSKHAEYNLEQDTVYIPTSTDYPSPEVYYFNLFKQLIRATGHPSRLNRIELLEEEPAFSKEELIDDMAAHYLCNNAGITGKLTFPNEGYIYGWMERLSNDPRLFVRLATQAQKAVDCILNNQKEPDGTEEESEETEPTDLKENDETQEEEVPKKKTRKKRVAHG